MVLSSAHLWNSAYMVLDTLGNRQWLNSLICDFYLPSIWHGSGGNVRCHFTMLFRLRPDFQLSPVEVDTYQHAHHVAMNGPCPMTPVAFLVQDPQSAYYFAVVFDYAGCTAYIFGRRISDQNPQYNPDWRAWRGPERWQIIADLHHWDPENSETVFVISRDWIQHGYDCGPIACAIIKECMEDGLEETWKVFLESSLTTGPPIPCGHILCLNMLGAIRQQCITSFCDYMHFMVHPQ